MNKQADRRWLWAREDMGMCTPREAFRLAYRSLRLEDQYTSDCLSLAHTYSMRTGFSEHIMNHEIARLLSGHGRLTREVCGEKMYVAAKRALQSRD